MAGNTTTNTTQTSGSIASKWGIDTSNIPLPSTGTKVKKSGEFVRSYVSRTIPNDLAIKDKINKVFQSYFKRDANQAELAAWLPAMKQQYIGKNGATKTNIKEVYKNGQLISTDYLTADNLDPALWLSDQIKASLAAAKPMAAGLGIKEGPTGQAFTNFKNFAYKNGIMLSDEAANDYANKVTAGTLDENAVYNTLRESAASAFPQLADKISAGIDLKTLADPYIQSMSNILEIPYSGIDLFDPKIRGALSFTQPDGKVGTKSIYDFEKELRQDPRWQYTNNAKQTVSAGLTQVLKDFGFMG